MRIDFKAALLLAATIALGAAESRAQTLTANVPFRFHITGAELPAGEYTIRRTSTDGHLLQLSNWKIRKSVLVMARNGIEASANTRPRMVFRCGESGCSLAEIWGATPTAGVAFAQPKATHDAELRMAVVYFGRSKHGH